MEIFNYALYRSFLSQLLLEEVEANVDIIKIFGERILRFFILYLTVFSCFRMDRCHFPLHNSCLFGCIVKYRLSQLGVVRCLTQTSNGGKAIFGFVGVDVSRHQHVHQKNWIVIEIWKLYYLSFAVFPSTNMRSVAFSKYMNIFLHFS